MRLQALAAAERQAEVARAEAGRLAARERQMRGAYADIQSIMAALPPPTPRGGQREGTPPAPWCDMGQAVLRFAHRAASADDALHAGDMRAAVGLGRSMHSFGRGWADGL